MNHIYKATTIDWRSSGLDASDVHLVEDSEVEPREETKATPTIWGGNQVWTISVIGR